MFYIRITEAYNQVDGYNQRTGISGNSRIGGWYNVIFRISREKVLGKELSR